jgi:hypothetical protein
MAILTEENLFAQAEERLRCRLIAVTTKFNSAEVAAIESAAKQCGVSRGEYIRDLVLGALHTSPGETQPPPELTEVVGLRLMLSTLLKPLAIGQRMTEETFDAVLAEVRRAQTKVAADLLRPKGGVR